MRLRVGCEHCTYIDVHTHVHPIRDATRRSLSCISCGRQGAALSSLAAASLIRQLPNTHISYFPRRQKTTTFTVGPDPWHSQDGHSSLSVVGATHARASF